MWEVLTWKIFRKNHIKHGKQNTKEYQNAQTETQKNIQILVHRFQMNSHSFLVPLII